MSARRVYNLVDFFELLGVTFATDWDGEVEATYPESVPIELLRSLVEDYTDEIRRRMEFRRRRAMQVCVGGGTLNGQRHSKFWPQLICKHLGRARWEVYAIARDGRAFYCGEASSQQKARRLAAARRAHEAAGQTKP